MAIEDPYVPVFMLVLLTVASRSDFRQFISNVSIVQCTCMLEWIHGEPRPYKHPRIFDACNICASYLTMARLTDTSKSSVDLCFYLYLYLHWSVACR